MFLQLCSSGEDALALFRRFQDCYCYSNSDVMRHVTKYCSVIVPHCTVRWDTACIRSSPDPFPSLAEVGRACETTSIHVHTAQVVLNASVTHLATLYCCCVCTFGCSCYSSPHIHTHQAMASIPHRDFLHSAGGVGASGRLPLSTPLSREITARLSKSRRSQV